jgi:formamidopyrimidine-DNA glycosylase
MPELPECETIVRDLRPAISGRTITALVIRQKAEKHLLNNDPFAFYEGVIGQEISTVLRKGKYILLPLINGNVIVFHLGMTGRLLLRPIPQISFDDRFSGDDNIHKHTHFMLELSDLYEGGREEDLELAFNDVRLFGEIWLAENVQSIEELDIPGLRGLGPDALGVSLAEFQKIIRRKRSVKAILLDQANLAGVGNIYTDEACFVAKVHPGVLGTSLTEEQQTKLWFAVKSVLKEGIHYRGSSVSDYTATDGSKGSYQEHHRVYGKFGKKCVECESSIERVKVSGRSTHFCPSCQPKEA